MRMDGKSVLVTGASSGLGAHFARVLAREGAAVTVAARREDKLAALCDEISASGGTVHARTLDVADGESVRALYADGGFDVLINNAGVAIAGPAIDYPEADWDRTLETNLKGCFLVAQAHARALRERGTGGAIVNVASITAIRVAGQLAAYAASKAALVQFTKATALEWARYGIRVNALCPGYIETPLNAAFFASKAGKAMIERIPQRRLGRPEDLDGPLLLLASDAGRYMTGSVVAVDGGHLVSSL